MTSPADVLPLEESQGERKPRNEHELTAQGYMLGNCAHCHNPRGFPSIKSPELKPILDLLPSATGGIFQFPLERVQPAAQARLRPGRPDPLHHAVAARLPGRQRRRPPNWTPKWFDCDANDARLCDRTAAAPGAARAVATSMRPGAA